MLVVQIFQFRRKHSHIRSVRPTIFTDRCALERGLMEAGLAPREKWGVQGEVMGVVKQRY